VSCKTNKTNENEVEIQLPEAKILNLERKIVEAELYRPMQLLFYDQKLIVYDEMKTSLFKVFDSRDLKYKYSFGSIGQGPTDFLSQYLTSISTPNHFEILDLEKLRYFDITDSAAFQISTPKAMAHKSGLINDLQKLSDSIYIFSNRVYSGSSFEKEFILYNIDNRSDREFGDVKYFDENMKDQTLEVQIESLSKSITTNIKNNKFAVFYSLYPYFKIFSSNPATLSRLYHINTETQPDGDCLYFEGVYSTDKYIYTLWIANSEEKIFEDLANFKPNLLVFDWNGNLIQNYKFDVPIHSFAVNDSNDKLYAVSPDENDINAIYVSDLNLK
jgi:hypothetical protein